MKNLYERGGQQQQPSAVAACPSGQIAITGLPFTTSVVCVSQNLLTNPPCDSRETEFMFLNGTNTCLGFIIIGRALERWGQTMNYKHKMNNTTTITKRNLAVATAIFMVAATLVEVGLTLTAATTTPAAFASSKGQDYSKNGNNVLIALLPSPNKTR